MSSVAGRCSRPLRCLWLGEASGGLEWLQWRMTAPSPAPPTGAKSRVSLERLPKIDPAAVAGCWAGGGIDRLIVGCAHRAAYPLETLRHLQAEYPDIPLAVACDSWWDGARRTGLVELPQLALPWYRWWDGWSIWLEGSQPELLGAAPPASFPWVMRCSRPGGPGGYEHANPTQQLPPLSSAAPPPAGMIIGNCRATISSWQMIAQAEGHRVELLSARQFRRQLSSAQAQPAWILWDDSCLDTSSRELATAVDPLEDFFEAAGQRYPAALLIAALSLARVEQWLMRPLAAGHEWIVKPDSGLALSRLLRAMQ